MNNRAVHILAIVIALLALAGCRSSSIDIGLRLDRYAPKIDPVKYQQYAGQQICLSNIGNDAQNTTIFYYFSPDGSARNCGSYFSHSTTRNSSSGQLPIKTLFPSIRKM